VRLDGDLRQVLLGRSVLFHALPRQHRPEGGAGQANAALAQVLGVVDVLDARGLDEALGHLLAADHEDNIVQPARHQRVADVEGVATRGAARREVVDGNASRPHLLDDVVAIQAPALAAGEAGAGGGHGLDLAPVDTGVGESGLDGLAAHLGHGLVGELSPGMHSQSQDGDFSHHAYTPCMAASAGVRPVETSR
jgi:hypothetical protein